MYIFIIIVSCVYRVLMDDDDDVYGQQEETKTRRRKVAAVNAHRKHLRPQTDTQTCSLAAIHTWPMEGRASGARRRS